MTQPNGTPVWFELASSDPEASGQIYGPVAEWQVAPSPNPAHGGHVIAGPDKATGVAGIMAAPEGIAVGRSVYFAAADADALAAHAVALGGAVRASPIDIPDVGRIALLADPQGVAFSVMAGVGADSSQAFVASDPAEEPAIGHGVWTELASPDRAGAFAFYGALFGWTRAGSMPMGAMGEYAFIGAGDGPVPGVIMSSTATGAPARWSWYVHVADIDQALDRVRAASGTVRQGADPIPGGGYSANIADPLGLGMGLVGPRQTSERG